MTSEVASNADFSQIRYAQCWEDADILLEALDIQPGDTCLSIASAGDNTLAMLSRHPGRVIALDLSSAQLACLELRVAAYRELSHPELLVLFGAKVGTDRQLLYQRCRTQLSSSAQQFWDKHPAEIEQGIGGAGKFERYFALFRRYVLPLVHNRSKVAQLLKGGTLEQRQAFYDQEWDTWQWRLFFRLFFSRMVMGRAGRDPSFFKYVEGNVADRILTRTHHALTQLNPAENPYLQWILTGTYPTALPYALRPENFEAIRANLDRLEWHCNSVEDFLEQTDKEAIDRFNLSDIFEYLSPTHYEQLLHRLVLAGRQGGRLAYWNMLAPRSRPMQMTHQLTSLTELAQNLHLKDKAFFYSAFVVEEIGGRDEGERRWLTSV
jgi:S-adenosylmethionine-diacylglycerol 3-amino-3-carboxypropyl transferase